jgi:DNA-binding HxlR family transcriptional regulator
MPHVDDPSPQAVVLEAISADRPADDHRRHVDRIGELLRKMAQFGNRREDPVRTIQAYLGDRWSSLIMHLLSGGMLRFNELKRLIAVVSAEHDISHRQLTLKLRVLERDGLLTRYVTDDVPPRVEYQLTALGHGAYAQFDALVRWTEQANGAIRASRETYDRAHPDGASLLKQQGEGAEG